MHLKVCLIAIFLGVSHIITMSADFVPVVSSFNNKKELDNEVSVGESLSSKSFLNNLNQLIGSKLNVILLDQLNSHDLRQSSQKLISNNLNFHPLVESAFDVLSENFKPQINLVKADSLDDAIFKFNQAINNQQDVLLTASRSEHLQVRQRRQASESTTNAVSNSSDLFIFGTNCTAMMRSIFLIDNSKSTGSSSTIDLDILEDASSFTCSDEDGISTLKIKINQTNDGIFGNKIDSIILEFTNDKRYWSLKSGNLTTTNGNLIYGLRYMGTPYGMETPSDFSFVCTRTYFELYNASLPTQANVKVALYIQYFQFQPFNVEEENSVYTFGKVNYCQGFFSSGIWMAITSSLILTFILAFGIALLFNVKTMDRFDDPKGKPLTIGAEK